MKGILVLRAWIRTNGEMSKDGKSITYDCKELDIAISDALKQSDNVDLANVSKCSHEWKSNTFDNMGFCLTEYCDVCDETRDTGC